MLSGLPEVLFLFLTPIQLLINNSTILRFSQIISVLTVPKITHGKPIVRCQDTHVCIRVSFIRKLVQSMDSRSFPP